MKKLDLARFQKSRESSIESGPFKFTIRRPSPPGGGKQGVTTTPAKITQIGNLVTGAV